MILLDFNVIKHGKFEFLWITAIAFMGIRSISRYLYALVDKEAKNKLLIKPQVQELCQPLLVSLDKIGCDIQQLSKRLHAHHLKTGESPTEVKEMKTLLSKHLEAQQMLMKALDQIQG